MLFAFETFFNGYFTHGVQLDQNCVSVQFKIQVFLNLMLQIFSWRISLVNPQLATFCYSRSCGQELHAQSLHNNPTERLPSSIFIAWLALPTVEIRCCHTRRKYVISGGSAYYEDWKFVVVWCLWSLLLSHIELKECFMLKYCSYLSPATPC